MENNLIKCAGNVIWDIMYLLKKSGLEELYYTGKLSLLVNRVFVGIAEHCKHKDNTQMFNPITN